MNNSPDHSDRHSVSRTALMATLHCLAGCSIGEILGLVIGNALDWGNWPTIGLAFVLAFVFGYVLTMLPLLRSGMTLAAALKTALAADTVSIFIMEIVDNVIMLVIPGAMAAGLDDWLFWASMATALILAGIAAFPVNWWLIGRGKEHAVAHGHHGRHAHDSH